VNQLFKTNPTHHWLAAVTWYMYTMSQKKTGPFFIWA